MVVAQILDDPVHVTKRVAPEKDLGELPAGSPSAVFGR